MDISHTSTSSSRAGELPKSEIISAQSSFNTSTLAEHYERVRMTSQALCKNLQTEDFVIQSMDDVSPTKWHLAHTSWFFETFILRAESPDYRPFHPDFEYLFNSYYNGVGPQFTRSQRGLLSRPTVAEIFAYRTHVDEQMAAFFHEHLSAVTVEEAKTGIAARILLGLHHEQQHQELMLMDIKHVFWTNPLRPALDTTAAQASSQSAPALRWWRGPNELQQIGFDTADPNRASFAYDNESPRHRVYLQPFEFASRLITNGEYLEFVNDGGYNRAQLWLSDGWAIVQSDGLKWPQYWERRDDSYWEMTLGGMRPLDLHAPVVHVSHYEADAYARWAGARLPTEAEWETTAADVAESNGMAGNFLESGQLHPVVAPPHLDAPAQLFGDVWEWTASAYLPYPGFEPAAGAIGEYNGKFMSGQMVMKGGCCATPASHIRATYRNFFPPGSRWQFAGIRLARDA